MIWFLTSNAFLEPLDFVDEGPGDMRRVDRFAKLRGAEFQIVHLAKQVRLLLATEQRAACVEVGKVRGHVVGRRLEVGDRARPVGHRAKDCGGGGCLEARVMDILELLIKDAHRPFPVDHPIDR
jgi:hypothetical protein